MQVNHKRVARIMREDNLLAVQPKDSGNSMYFNDTLDVYLNIPRRIRLNSVDQLLVTLRAGVWLSHTFPAHDLNGHFSTP